MKGEKRAKVQLQSLFHGIIFVPEVDWLHNHTAGSKVLEKPNNPNRKTKPSKNRFIQFQ